MTPTITHDVPSRSGRLAEFNLSGDELFAVLNSLVDGREMPVERDDHVIECFVDRYSNTVHRVTRENCDGLVAILVSKDGEWFTMPVSDIHISRTRVN